MKNNAEFMVGKRGADGRLGLIVGLGNKYRSNAWHERWGRRQKQERSRRNRTSIPVRGKPTRLTDRHVNG